MPLVVNNYKWTQTEKKLTIKVPIKAIQQAKADIFQSPRYLKVLFDQYFFEVLLLHPVDIPKSTCIVVQDMVIFELVKETEEIWESLEPNITKKEKFDMKMKLIEEEHQRFQEECKQKQNIKHELKRVATKQQMKLDTKVRDNIDQVRNEEKVKVLGDLEKWQLKMEKKIKRRNKKLEKRREKPLAPIELSLPTESDEERNMPKPRTTRDLTVDFTPREFPTPCRESRLEEENEWLRKQAEARRSVGFVSEDIRPEERNPQFLKAKGDEFMKAENYLGAISAYTFGIKLSDKFSDLYVARSKAHLKLGNFHKTIYDCSTALELMKPAVLANLQDRASCIGRRGIGLCKIGKLSKGIAELEASLELVPDNMEFKEFLKEAEKQWMHQSDSDD